MKKYLLTEKTTGNVFAVFETYHEAVAAQAVAEEADKDDGCYIPGFYEIKEG